MPTMTSGRERLPRRAAVALLLLGFAAVTGCGGSGSSTAGTRSEGRQGDGQSRASVATRCPAARRLDVPGAFDFRRVKAPGKAEPETELSCAYRSGAEQGDALEPTALITFIVGDYGEGVDQNFDAAVELARCSESDDVDPANCTTDIDQQYSRYERTDDSVEAIEVDEPLGDIAPNPDNRFGVFSAAYKNETKICATSVLQGVSASDDPRALVALGENVIGMVRSACGR
jgi:hypothetical protein